MNLRNYWPKVSAPECSSGGSLSVSALGFGGSLPMQNCAQLEPNPNANTFKMGVAWDAGSCKDQTSEGADLGMVVDVKPGTLAVLSDYSYARFSTSSVACDLDASNDVRAIYADPGW